MSACACDDEPAEHEDGQVYFPVRAIGQHDRVVNLQYVYDKSLEITLDNDKRLLVAIIQAYDLTAEELRSARKKMGKFDIALKNNPNGRITSGAREAAEGMSIQVLLDRRTPEVHGKRWLVMNDPYGVLKVLQSVKEDCENKGCGS